MSHYVNRPLLYVSRHHDASLCRYLSQHGWKLVFANSLEDLAALPLDGPFSAGLLDFQSGFSDADLELMEPWLATRQIGWIGAISCADELTDTARKLLGLYFIDYYTAPFDMAELSRTLGHAVGMAALRPGREQPAVPLTRPHGIIGECNAMQALFRSIEKVSRWDTPVLISGESGTGKELAAQAIHRASRRANQPFVAVNCAAIPPTLLMSELFGYERGAFTGATKRKPGRIEIAQGGTLFLDEIGDMPLESQTSLLRFLETGRIERLGGTESVAVDVRVISATHVDLEAAVATERFRGDLFHRLCVLRVKQPPCANAAPMCCCWPNTSWIPSARTRPSISAAFRPWPCVPSPPMPGQAMCANCSTGSALPRRCARTGSSSPQTSNSTHPWKASRRRWPRFAKRPSRPRSSKPCNAITNV